MSPTFRLRVATVGKILLEQNCANIWVFCGHKSCSWRALLMAVAIPDAYGRTGLEFAGAYLAVSLWAFGIQGRGLWSVPASRRPWLQYLPLAAVAPILVLVGTAGGRGSRTIVWTSPTSPA